MIDIDHFAVCKMVMLAYCCHCMPAICHTCRRLILTNAVRITIQTCWEKFAVCIFIFMILTYRPTKNPIISTNII